MTQHAVLRGDLPLRDDVVGHFQQPADRAHGVVGRVDSDDRVAGAERQALVDRGLDALDRVRRVVRLQARADGAGKAHRVLTVGDIANLLGRHHQVEIAHQLRDAGDHFTGQRIADPMDVGAGGVVGQQPFAELAHRPALDLVVDRLVEGVVDRASDIVLVVRHGRVLAQNAEGHLCQHFPCRNPLGSRMGCDSGLLVARLLLVGLGQQLLDVGELICVPEQLRPQQHHFTPWS